MFWFFVLVWMPAYAADAPRQLAWEDLVVALPPAENPFASLSVEQLDLLADVGGYFVIARLVAKSSCRRKSKSRKCPWQSSREDGHRHRRVAREAG